MDNSNSKISPPGVSFGSLGSRAALELVRNSRLRSSCPMASSTSLTDECSLEPLSAASFVAMRNGNRCHKDRHQPASHGVCKHKKALIPITSKQTSRVLNNVSVDCVFADVRIDDCHHHNSIACSKGLLESPNKRSLVSESVCKNDDTISTDSCGSDAASNDGVYSNPSSANWRNIRSSTLKTSSHRYSISSFGSTASDEDIWIPQSKN